MVSTPLPVTQVFGGNPYSDDYQPSKTEIIQYLKALEAAIEGGDLTGLAAKSYIVAFNVRNVNKLAADTDIPVPAQDGGALIALPIVTANTASPVTVSFNGGAALTVKDNTASDIGIGGLQPGVVAGFKVGSTFQLLSTQATAALLAQITELKNEAEAAKTGAETAEAGAQVARTGSEAARDIAAGYASDAVSQGNVPIYGTALGAAALTIPAGITAFRTNGYAASGDKGGAIYDEVGAAVTGGVSTNGGTRFWAPRIIDRVDPRWYGAKANGVDSDVAAVRTAYAVSRLHNVFVYLSTGQWVFDDYITSGATEGLDIRGDGRDKTVILHRAPLTRLFSHVGGDMGAPIAVTQAAIRSNTVVVADTAGLEADMWVVIQDPDVPVIYHLDGSTVCDTGQVCRIRKVKDGTNLEMWGQNEFTYGPNSFLRPMPDMIDGIRASGMTFVNETPGSLGEPSRCFALTRCFNLDFRDIDAKRLDDDFVAMVYCQHGDFDVGLWYLNDAGGGTPYGISCGEGTCDMRIKVRQRGGRHSVTCASTVGEVESVDVVIHDSLVTETDHSAFDTHPGARRWTYQGCTAFAAGQAIDGEESTNGIQIRGRDCRVINCVTVGYNGGAYLVGGENNVVKGCDFGTVDVGVRIRKSPGSVVKDVRSTSTTNTVLLDDEGADVSTDCDIDDITERGDPSVAFNFVNFPKGTRVGKLHAPKSALFSAGIPADALYYGDNFEEVAFSSLNRSRLDSAAVSPLTSGKLFLAAIKHSGGQSFRKLYCHVQSAGSGQTHFFMALYDKDFNLLSQTPDEGATPLGTGLNTFNLLDRIQPENAGLYYIGICQVATAMATFSGHVSQTGIVAAAPKLALNADGALTDTAPATATYSANVNMIPYVGTSS